MTNRTPAYRLHKPSGQAVVTLAGRDFYLGKWNTPSSRAEYDRLVAEWLANGRGLTRSGGIFTRRPCIAEIILAFLRYAEKRYSPEGRELENFRHSLRPLRDLYGHTIVSQFGPKALKTIQQRMIELGWCRNVINRRITRIKTMFKWAESEELVPAATYHALRTVRGLSRRTPGVRESSPIEPAFWDNVAAILPYCSRTLGTMLQLQWWSGMRSRARFDSCGP